MSLDLFRKLNKAGIEVLAGDPGTNLFEGRVVFNSTAQTLKVYEAGAWKLTASLGAVGDTITPVGSIVAYNPGYYTGVSNAGFTLVGPVTNTVAGVNAFLPLNWRVCDGTALNDGGSPIWNAVGRFLPHLLDDRFLRGSVSAGSLGGAPSVALAITNLPAHEHNMSHGHAHTLSTDTAGSGHGHGFSLTAAGQSLGTSNISLVNGVTGSGSSVSSSLVGIIPSAGGVGGIWAGHNIHRGNTTSGVAGDGSYPGQPHGHSVSGTTNIGHTHGASSVSGSVGGGDGGHTHGVTGGVTIISANTGSIGSGSSFAIVPSYLSTFFIVRIK